MSIKNYFIMNPEYVTKKLKFQVGDFLLYKEDGDLAFVFDVDQQTVTFWWQSDQIQQTSNTYEIKKWIQQGVFEYYRKKKSN